jgi:hypothetical protein
MEQHVECAVRAGALSTIFFSGKRDCNTSADATGSIAYSGGDHRRYPGARAFVVSTILLWRYGLLSGGLRQLVETVSGWLYVPSGNLFEPEQVQPSHDHNCHVCLGQGDHRSICAFIVPNV